MVIRLAKTHIEIGVDEKFTDSINLYLCLDKDGKFDLRKHDNKTLIATYHERETEIDEGKRITYIGIIDTLDNRVNCRIYLFWDRENSIHLVATAKDSGQTIIHRIIAFYIPSFIPIKNIIYNEFDIGNESVLNYTDNPPSGFIQRYEDEDYFRSCYEVIEYDEDPSSFYINCKNCGSGDCELINKAKCLKTNIHPDVKDYVNFPNYEHDIDYDKLNVVMNEEQLKEPLQIGMVEYREVPSCSPTYSEYKHEMVEHKFFSDIWNVESTIDEILFNFVRFYQSTHLCEEPLDKFGDDIKMAYIGNSLLVYNRASLSMNYKYPTFRVTSSWVDDFNNIRKGGTPREIIFKYNMFLDGNFHKYDKRITPLGYYIKTYEGDNKELFDLYCTLENGEIMETIIHKESGKVISKCRLTKNNARDYMDFGINLAEVNEIDKICVNDDYVLFVNKGGVLVSYCDVSTSIADDNIHSLFRASYDYLYGEYKTIGINHDYTKLFNVELLNTIYTVGLNCDKTSANLTVNSDKGETVTLDGIHCVYDCIVKHAKKGDEFISHENFKFSYASNKVEIEDKTKSKHDSATKKLDLF